MEQIVVGVESTLLKLSLLKYLLLFHITPVSIWLKICFFKEIQITDTLSALLLLRNTPVVASLSLVFFYLLAENMLWPFWKVCYYQVRE
jgi:hypothetical protein